MFITAAAIASVIVSPEVIGFAVEEKCESLLGGEKLLLRQRSDSLDEGRQRARLFPGRLLG